MVSNLKVDDKKQTTDTITKYFKVGNAQLNTVTKKDGELTELMNTVVTESLDYWGTNPTITGKLNELSKACENKEKTLGLNVDQSKNDQNNANTNTVTESVEIIYLEADGDQNNQQQNGNQDQSNLAEKFGWVSEAVRVFVGCLMNAIRDKYNDYYTLAYQFAQANNKNKNTDQKNDQNKNTSDNNQNGNNDQNQSNQTDQK